MAASGTQDQRQRRVETEDEVEGEISRRIVDFSRCAASYIQRPAGGWVRYRSARSTTQRSSAITMKDGAIGQLLLVLIACSSIYGNETDRLSLLEFKKLGNQYRSAASIDGLVAHVSPSLGNLTFLKHLSLATNMFNWTNTSIPGPTALPPDPILDIKGNFPNEIAKLSELQILYVGSNQSAVRFPQAIMNLSNLVSLVLYSNNLNAMNFFHGPIPSSLINASNLNTIDVPNNRFSGVVPCSIGKLAKLSKLNLEMNKFQACT
ncbi:hypothetical protein EJB05_29162 [Eragrostis curvula]|uniref:Leucine-rich repeat-containing N-terminal plant-type domain-containing protein n=1 Tax=Eragrostis curvula TaxID=38414 RepID=A0A5J9UTJ7_9POAL|nr:hypothetical protein EJB05_29162 [Eragrostis curvula]